MVHAQRLKMNSNRNIKTITTASITTTNDKKTTK